MRILGKILLALITAFILPGANLVAQIANVPQAGAPDYGIRILTPKPGATLDVDFVSVNYEVVAGTSGAEPPIFQLQLDAQAPIQTPYTEQTFTGLKPGRHILTIQVVDANSRPIPGLRNQVEFRIVRQQQPGSGPTSGAQPPAQSTAGYLQLASDQKDSSQLPDGGSALPLLSVIGCGVLVGGIFSALRTKPKKKTNI